VKLGEIRQASHHYRGVIMKIIKLILGNKLKAIGIIALLAVGIFFITNQKPEGYVEIDSNAVNSPSELSNRYHQVSTSWDVDPLDDFQTILDGNDLDVNASYSDLFDGDTFEFSKGDTITIDVNVDSRGAYVMALEYMDIGDTILDNQMAVYVNGELQFEESETIELPSQWEFVTDEFSR
jgi:hypothetical protein